MRKSDRHAGLADLGTIGRLLAISVGAGLLAAAVAVPVVGAIGVVTRNAANTFNTLKVPSLGQLPARSELLDTKGHLIAYYYPNNINRVPVSYNQISPVMREAILAIEDNRFYLHGAFDLRGTVRALVNDVSGRSTQGGSTLAQEYVKNALILTATNRKEQLQAAEETVERKIRELRIAAIVEHEMTKNQLLAAYLSAAYFNNNAYGVQVAAQRYFKTDALHLTLRQAALLAGIVRNPSAYDPLTNAKAAKARRNVVLQRMVQTGYITQAQADATGKLGLGLHSTTAPLQSGCTSDSAADAAFFCDFVLASMKVDPAYKQAYKALNTVGGLKIYTTMNPKDQAAAQHAVNFVEPPGAPVINPGHNVDTEVLMSPGTGYVRAIAVNRPYGNGPGHTTIDYAAETPYNGGQGVQTGSSSKLFTLVTALKQGVPFGFTQGVVSPSSIGPYFNCQGAPTSVFNVVNAEGNTSKPEVFTLYNGTTQSINVFYAHLEQKVGLCNVVKTAATMGLTFANGKSLLKPDGALNQLDSADNNPSFTLGSEPVAPMDMAAAYATVAARGIYCRPIAISHILTRGGKELPVKSANCHQAIPQPVADAVNFILQGVITSGTAAGRGIGVPVAGKTGTANGGFYAAFGGYTPRLAGYVSVFNPTNPTGAGAMIGSNACYREVSGFESCPGQMFGDNAPGATWQLTFQHAALGLPPAQFVGVPANSPFFSLGTGINSPKPPKPPKKPKPGGGGGGNGGGGGGNGGGGPGNGNGNGNGGGGGPPT